MKLWSLLLILISPWVWSSTYNSQLILKQVNPDGETFTFLRAGEGEPPWNGLIIKDPTTKVILYQAAVLKCNTYACAAVVIKNASGLKLRADENYIYSVSETLLKAPTNEVKLEEPKAVAEIKTEEKKEEKKELKKEETPLALARAIYSSYGSPIGPGMKLGYGKKTPRFWYLFNYSKISSSAKNVSLDGHLLSSSLSFKVLELSPALEVNVLGELGLAKAHLDFTKVDKDAPVKDEFTYFGALAGEIKYDWERFSLAMKSGLTKTGFAGYYKGTYGNFNNPYGTILMFLELGAYYRF